MFLAVLFLAEFCISRDTAKRSKLKYLMKVSKGISEHGVVVCE